MVDVAQYINEVKRDSEHLDIIHKIRVSAINVNKSCKVLRDSTKHILRISRILGSNN